MGVLFLAGIYTKRIILLLNWQSCKCRAAFFAAKKQRKKKKHAKKRKRILKKILKKNQLVSIAGSMLKKYFVKA